MSLCVQLPSLNLPFRTYPGIYNMTDNNRYLKYCIIIRLKLVNNSLKAVKNSQEPPPTFDLDKLTREPLDV